MRVIASIAVVLALAAAPATPQASKVLTTDTLWDWRTAGDPQISPDGKVVVYTLGWNDRMNDAMHSNLWIVSVDGKDHRPLTQGAFRDTSPRWSPDGTRLAYLSNRSGKAQIHVRWMDTGQEAKITDLEQGPENIAWSPDGKWIAYAARVPGKPAWSVPMPEKPAGAKWAEPPIVVTRLRWRFDGAGLIPPGYTHVFIVPSEGGAPRQITSGDFDHIGGPTGGRSSGGPVWTPDGEWILTACQRVPLESSDIVTFLAGQPSRTTRLTAANDSLLADRKLGAVEEITFDSFDGRTIQGWIVKPPDFSPSKKYPLILDIHGGPHAMYGVEFNHQFQAYAARGFVVLYTNPRGSTGYGEEFGNVIHTNYPGDDYKDLMAGVDAILKKGYVDEKRMAVTGGSGGGLLTAWIIGQTDRFTAAVSQYPVSDWITQAGTADGGYFFAAVWMKAMPWENPGQYLKHSPIFYAKNFKTPTMVITGEQDLRTPMAQSEELYFALKAQKVDAVLVRIPDEPHGIRGAHPSHRIWKMEHVLGWISKYTKAQS